MDVKRFRKIQKEIQFQANDLLKKIQKVLFLEHKTKTTKIYVDHWMTKWPHRNLLDVVSVKVSRTLLIVWNDMKL